MGSPRFVWAVTAAVLPLVAMPAGLAQTSRGPASSDLGRNTSATDNPIEQAPRKPPRRGRSRTGQRKTTLHKQPTTGTPIT